MQGESLMLTKDENIIKIEAVVRGASDPTRCKDISSKFQDAGRFGEEGGRISDPRDHRSIRVPSRDDGRSLKIEAQGDRPWRRRCSTATHAGISIEQVSLQDVGAPQEVIELSSTCSAPATMRTSAVNDAQAYRNKVVQGAAGPSGPDAGARRKPTRPRRSPTPTVAAQRFLSVLRSTS